jgi:hypothetical protein
MKGLKKLEMKKNSSINTNEHQLTLDIREIISQARLLTLRSVNSLQVISNYLIGMRIVEEEQQGYARAKYGNETLKQLSVELTAEFGRGYSLSNLKNMRKFFLSYPLKEDEKSQTLSGFFERPDIWGFAPNDISYRNKNAPPSSFVS